MYSEPFIPNFSFKSEIVHKFPELCLAWHKSWGIKIDWKFCTNSKNVKTDIINGYGKKNINVVFYELAWFMLIMLCQ